MKHRRTPHFAQAFEKRPQDMKDLAKKTFLLFVENPSHPSLNIERVEGYPGVYSSRITQKYRWTFHFEADPETGERVCVHRVIGGHDEVYREP